MSRKRVCWRASRLQKRRDVRAASPAAGRPPRTALTIFGAEVVTASPEEFAAVQSQDRERYGTFIREANIRVD